MKPVEYAGLSLREIESLDRRRTVLFMTLSPLEVHGPHLPVGTDAMVAAEVQRRVQAELDSARPDLVQVNLPPLYCGADAVPVPGSIAVRASALETVLSDYVEGAAAAGFRYLVLMDNHGGPRHLLAVFSAARQAWRQRRFYLLHPFAEIYRRMIRDDPELLAMTGLSPGQCGDDADNHAGTNETSLALAIGMDKLEGNLSGIPVSEPPAPRGFPKMLDGVGALLSRLGAPDAGTDLRHLARTLAWVGEKPLVPYIGAPAAASCRAGEAMLRAHVAITQRLLERALTGEEILPVPVLGRMSFLRLLPG